MEPITTKRHPIKFYFLLVFTFLFLCFLGTSILFIFIDLLQKEKGEFVVYLLPLVSLMIFSIAFTLVYAYWKNAPIITIKSETVQFGSQIFYLKDIKAIVLTGKKSFRFVDNNPMEGTSIPFKDGTEKIFFDDMYSNSWEIKSFLEQTVINKQEYRQLLPNSLDGNLSGFETEEIFKGNQFTTFLGIMLWGFSGFVAYMLFNTLHDPFNGGFLVLSTFGLLLFFVLLSSAMNYFVLTRDYLIIRNHNFIWKSKIYLLKNIKEVVFEGSGRQENSLVVITKDYKSKRYVAGTLREKNWFNFKNNLEKLGVIVRNEGIYSF